MSDVAKVAGVSTKTVSNVVNDFHYVSAATRERVLAAIEKLGYEPNLTARRLRLGHSGVIKLVIPDLRNAYFAELANSVMEAAAKSNVFVLIEQTGFDRQRELEILHGPSTQLVDGILFSALALGEQDANLVTSTVPIVLLGEQIFNGPTDHVTMRNVEAVRAATEHLLSIGRTRIIALGANRGATVGSSALRLRGYRDALKGAGVPYDPKLVGYAGSWHRSDGARTIEKFLAKKIEFDGIVAFSDTVALGAMRILQEEGLRIPEDVAIIGFDNIDETQYSLPTLSTVDAGRDEIAQMAVSLLLERVLKPDEEIPPREIYSNFHVIARESTTGGRVRSGRR
jgi:DNA-binding LacI/PurR family transcriptional regulator